MSEVAGYVVCLDVGDRRIGVALASTIARLPAPLTTVDRDDIDGLVQLLKQQDASLVVIGLPRDINGRQTEQTVKTQNFAEALAKRINLPIVWQDESVTSIKAEERLQSRGVDYTKADIDAESAVIILEDYLTNTHRRTA
ncbi:Holliday junction resolvase RuvX [Candidatus Saccharibacteria bacterium]|nr:Holliday junction resolvase RuvX [Candidatus Saccharibacteria bacterium]